MKNPWKQYSKINPQKEEGNRQICNTVFRALIKAHVSGSELRVALLIIDKTWGFGKPVDCISVSQIVKSTGLAERTIKKAIKSLKVKRIIYYEPSNIRVNRGSPLNQYLFNKHYDTWKAQGCTNVHACTKRSNKGAQKGQTRVHDQSPTKETITKETIQKKKDDIPYDAIADLYNTILDDLPAMRLWTKRRKSVLRQRWIAKVEAKKLGKTSDTLEFWEGLFNYIKKSPFLMGKKGSFSASFDWIIQESNFVKIFEGNYHK